MIVSVRHTHTRAKNEKMAMLTLEDLTGKCDAVVFPDAFRQAGPVIAEEAMLFVCGTVDRRRERPGIVVQDLIPMDQAIVQLTGQVMLRLSGENLTGGVLTKAADLLKANRGSCPVLLEVTPTGRPEVRTTIRSDKQWFVKPSRELLEGLEGLLKQENLHLTPRVNSPSNGGRDSGRYSRRRATSGAYA